MRADFIVFTKFSKSIREKDGEINLREPLDNKSQIRRFLFSVIKKYIINRTGFDSDPERRCAIVLEDDTEVLKWVRPPANQMPIYSQGSTYNVDFVAETATDRYLIEVKARDEAGSDDTKEKALGGQRSVGARSLLQPKAESRGRTPLFRTTWCQSCSSACPSL